MAGASWGGGGIMGSGRVGDLGLISEPGWLHPSADRGEPPQTHRGAPVPGAMSTWTLETHQSRGNRHMVTSSRRETAKGRRAENDSRSASPLAVTHVIKGS